MNYDLKAFVNRIITHSLIFKTYKLENKELVIDVPTESIGTEFYNSMPLEKRYNASNLKVLLIKSKNYVTIKVTKNCAKVVE